ncbi:three-helix bundle dimerization domain-containing protein [Streptomyces sp. NPDC058464]|uniref:three-helix bundle dimerization domain-containing protein n=1 Tax=Streptomyces sp. NPDC058464 TaxID=3346511 RepID=UPI003659359C
MRVKNADFHDDRDVDLHLTARGTTARESQQRPRSTLLGKRLKDAFGATRSQAEVKAAVAKAYASSTDRPVREFIPVLVERPTGVTPDCRASRRSERCLSGH